MKKTLVSLMFAGVVALSLQSCQTTENLSPLVTQRETVSLKVNESYTFTLPTDDNDDPYSITLQASNYRVSQIGTDANGNTIYEYTPGLDFVGPDSVIVSNDHEIGGGGCHQDGDSTHHHGGHHGQGGHKGGGLLHLLGNKDKGRGDTHHEITFVFDITGDTQTVK